MATLHFWPIDEAAERMCAANTSVIGVDGVAIMELSGGDKCEQFHQTKEVTIKRLHDGIDNTFVSAPGCQQRVTSCRRPTSLVLKPGLVIHSIYNGYWFGGRPSFVDLWHDLRAVTREIRRDWDLCTPGLREAWDAGDFSRFHGWNKRVGPDSPSVGRNEQKPLVTPVVSAK